jgi:hypothetical protein
MTTAGDEGPTLNAEPPVDGGRLARVLAEGVNALQPAVRRVLGAVSGRRPFAFWAAGAVLLAAALCLLVLLKKPAATPPPAPEAAPAAAAPAPSPPPVPPAPEPPAAAADEGFLELTLLPGGTVSIDGKEAAVVEGMQRFTLKAGRHEVMASDSKVITAWSVNVRPGATVKKQFTFPRHR